MSKVQAFLLVILLTLAVASDDEQCSYTFIAHGNCEDLRIKFYDSWNGTIDKPTGNSLEFELNGCEATKMGVCTNFCALEMVYPMNYAGSGLETISLYFLIEEDDGFDAVGNFLFDVGVNQPTNIKRRLIYNQCERSDSPKGTKLISLDSLEDSVIQIPDTCTYTASKTPGSGSIMCPECFVSPPPPSTEQCLYDIKIKTSCDPFSGNPFGKVSVILSDDIGTSRYSIQPAGRLVVFENLRDQGITKFATCSLAKFTRRDTCIDFCAMQLTLRDTSLKWKVEYVEVSTKYAHQKFKLDKTLRPGKEQIDQVLAPKCKLPPEPNHIYLGTFVLYLPEKCSYKPIEAYRDRNFRGSIVCNCIDLAYI